MSASIPTNEEFARFLGLRRRPVTRICVAGGADRTGDFRAPNQRTQRGVRTYNASLDLKYERS